VRQAHDELERPAGALLLFRGARLGVWSIPHGGDCHAYLQGVPHAVTQMLVGLAYAVGFICVVIGQSELFTEQTTSAVLSVLSRRANLNQLLWLWGLC
jgi:formate/nitrite transporter FocA (FNT family)